MTTLPIVGLSDGARTEFLKGFELSCSNIARSWEAALFVLLPFLEYLYSLATRFIKSCGGRKRFSVLGAINAVSKELVMIMEIRQKESAL